VAVDTPTLEAISLIVAGNGIVPWCKFIVSVCAQYTTIWGVVKRRELVEDIVYTLGISSGFPYRSPREKVSSQKAILFG